MTVGTASRTTSRTRPKRPPTHHGSPAPGIDIRLVARSIAQAAVEVLAGTRPIQQLARSMNAECFLSLQQRAALTREHMARNRTSCQIHQSPMVRSVRVCSISETIHEAAVVVSEEQRSRAIAMRLEHQEGMWQVTALEIG
ncbi:MULTISPECIES: Rv3235 family protein [unclassified Paenarthrobacter]|uniref:Rv3235 family protein n=1 Tax=unclassified Paenarthrobacter TaxID=2634190 RepID=UPI003CF0BE22